MLQTDSTVMLVTLAEAEKIGRDHKKRGDSLQAHSASQAWISPV